MYFSLLILNAISIDDAYGKDILGLIVIFDKDCELQVGFTVILIAYRWFDIMEMKSESLFMETSLSFIIIKCAPLLMRLVAFRLTRMGAVA